MGGGQNYGPFLGTLNIRGRIIIGTQKGTIILTTTLLRILFPDSLLSTSKVFLCGWHWSLAFFDFEGLPLRG